MRLYRPLRAPLWFHLVIAIGAALAARALIGPDGGAFMPASPPAPVSLAFWGWLVVIAEAIWNGIQAVADLTITVLHWLLLQLWAIVVTIGNGLVALGKVLKAGFIKAWDFLDATYEHVLKPAWEKFWKLFDKVRTWLTDTFGPVFRFLKAVRDDILCFYTTWIRPILDITDATRGILRILARLHVPFAAALERQIGKAEDWVNQKFEFVLAKINEVVNLVNRIVTADGLFQRLAFIRTYARDIEYAASLFWQAQIDLHRKRPEGLGKARRLELTNPDEYRRELGEFYRSGTGAYASDINDLVAEWRTAADIEAATAA